MRAPAPTAYTEAVLFCRGRSQTGPRAATWGRPYDNGKHPQSGAVRTPPPTREWTGSVPSPQAQRCVGSEHPGAAVESQRGEFSTLSGPLWARVESRCTTRISTRRKRTTVPEGGTPVMGVRGKATMSTKCSSGAVPGGVLVPLPPWAKELAARRRRNPPADNEPNPKPVPSSVTASPCHLPPGGEGFGGEPPHPAPSGPPSPQGEGLKRAAKSRQI